MAYYFSCQKIEKYFLHSTSSKSINSSWTYPLVHLVLVLHLLRAWSSHWTLSLTPIEWLHDCHETMVLPLPQSQCPSEFPWKGPYLMPNTKIMSIPDVRFHFNLLISKFLNDIDFVDLHHRFRFRPLLESCPLKRLSWTWVSCAGEFSQTVLPRLVLPSNILQNVAYPISDSPISESLFVARIVSSESVERHDIVLASSRFLKLTPCNDHLLLDCFLGNPIILGWSWWCLTTPFDTSSSCHP